MMTYSFFSVGFKVISPRVKLGLRGTIGITLLF
jgi:hypothetical protein